MSLNSLCVPPHSELDLTLTLKLKKGAINATAQLSVGFVLYSFGCAGSLVVAHGILDLHCHTREILCDKSLQSRCPTLCNTANCIARYQAPLSMEILQARMLQRGAISYSRGSSRLRDQTGVSSGSRIGRQVLYH